ncbi:uncharacterized protein DDB_G0287625-like isoform X2 [Mangifera indica]|uniref:uncharacterized protein DDB_G0287625-like isoform X2 n=1 Tax=Mangifera indica TaxID=29780 RepID=UPI001CFAED3B|nr:uncharacterized protein DDB_G0287625-like isoform X2 [Mangifera indica]
MEGVGARLGRSSTRYGPTTVFTGPVRKWKKRWIHVSPSNNNTNNNSSNNPHPHQNHHNSNGSNGSHLLLYKWTSLSRRDNNGKGIGNSDNGNGDKGSVKDDTMPEEPPRRKFKYMPIAVLEEQKRAAEIEAAENAENEAKPTDTETSAHRSDGFDEKPDINDVPMEENQVVRQDLNESTLDLSLGLKAHDGDSNSKTDLIRDGKLERLNSSK